jgi:hypothetical protein
MVMMMPQPRPEIGHPVRPITLPNAADQATFQMLDGDGNDKVSRDEWIRAGWTADRFEAFDGNNDGQITQDEFMQGRRFEKEFNQKDWNGDGKLNRFEMNGFQNIMYKATNFGKGIANAAIDKVDGFFPGFADRFGRFDTNDDGAVSKKEYFQARRREESIQNPPIWKPRPPIAIDPILPHPPIFYNKADVRPTAN